MSPQKGFSAIPLLILGIVVIIGGYIAYLSFQNYNNYSSLKQNAFNQNKMNNHDNSVNAPEGDSTLNEWETYRSEKFRFELKHPKSVKINESNDLVDFTTEPVAEMNVGGGISARVRIIDSSNKRSSLPDIHQNTIGHSCNTELGGKCEELTFNGYQALKVTDYVNVSDNLAYYILNNEKIYILSTQKEHMIPNQILSTFKILEE